ncbi:cytochrome C oxidase subunit IV family protein [Salinithrix halophila]|uniref:Cytochrome C oxidase subunit IV family protein n=1 Tax=Salinithrix halophila TaxID=1485204 RepID=A0ABV8JH24_9BACL
MESNIEQNTQTTHAAPSGTKYVMSFVWMILLTAAAFAAVMLQVIPDAMVIPFIIALAAVQVILQLFTFMHLDLKNNWLTVMFTFTGLGIGLICAIALWLIS